MNLFQESPDFAKKLIDFLSYCIPKQEDNHYKKFQQASSYNIIEIS